MSKRLDLTSLELFVAVCEAKSLARAAELENIAASAISKRITQLEQQTGTTLLVRSRGGVVPTTAGQTLLEHARNVLYNLDLINRDLSNKPQGLRGHIRIVASASAVAEFLPASIASFLANPAHRDIDVDIEELVSHEVVESVREGRAMLGVCWDDADLSGLEVIPYKSDRLAVAVHKSHPLSGKAQVSFAETLDYQHAGLRPSSAMTAMLRRESLRAGKLIKFRVLVSAFPAALAVVKAGLAISIIPMETAQQLPLGTEVTMIPLSDSWARRNFVICCRNRRNLPQVADLLLTHLLAH